MRINKIVTIGLLVLIVTVAGCVSEQATYEKSPSPDTTTVVKVVDTVVPTPVPTPVPTVSAEQAKREAITVTYDDLLRDSENYIGKIVYFRLGAIQVNDYGNGEYLIITVPLDSNEYPTANPIQVLYKGKRIINGDMIDVWGRMQGVENYITVQGGQQAAPKLDALYIEVVKKSGTW